MSAFSTVLVVDLPADTDPEVLRPVLSGAPGGVWQASLPGHERFTCSSGSIELVEPVTTLLASLDGRAALAVDQDEHGALWVVLASAGGQVRTVHRRYVLNADPEDADEVAAAVAALGRDPRAADVAGEQAAADAAQVFEVEAARVQAAERASASAYRDLGTVGGPFPWWAALGLEWPGSAAGVRVLDDLG